MDFQRLLGRFNTDPEKAWSAYLTLRRKLITFFAHRPGFDAEDLAEETLDRLASKYSSEETRNIAELAFGVARNVRHEATRRAAVNAPLDVLKEGGRIGKEDTERTFVERIDFQQKLDCFLKCMRCLSPADRQLLLLYYPLDNEQLKTRRANLAVSLHLNLGALRTRVARLRERLEACFQACRAGLAETERPSATLGVAKESAGENH